MSDVIGFLEAAGRCASARIAPVHAWSGFDALDEAQRDALLSSSLDALARTLDARPVMLCMISLPDDGETETPDDVPDADTPDDAPGDDDDETLPA